MDREAIRAKIRAQIRPFPREAHYPTGWSDPLTFADICAALTPSITRLMRYYRYVDVDIPDMIAHGFMRLWEELSQNPSLLTDLDQGGAAKWVMYRSGSYHYTKFYRREMYMEELAARNGDPDEFIVEGYEGRWYTDRSEYSRQIDLRLDIEAVMKQMAEKYEDSRAHLAALYYITTSVSPDDAAELADRGGTKKAWWLTSIVKPMREELCELLELPRPEKVTWQEKVRAGETAPLEALLERCKAEGKEQMAVTIEALAENASTKAIIEKLALPQSHVHYLRRTAHQELNRAYGCGY